MTINEQHRVSTESATERPGARQPVHALVDRLNAGEPYAVAFGGQGAGWLENLEELVSSAGIESELSQIVAEAELLLEPVARELVVVRPIGFEPMQWVRALAAEEPLPPARQLTTAAISAPGILLNQIAAIRALVRQGLDLYGAPPVATAGHSQGKFACTALAAKGARDAEILAMLQLGGAAGSLISRRRGMVGRGNKTPMVSVTNVDPERIGELLEEFSKDVRTVLPPVLSIRNGRRSISATQSTGLTNTDSAKSRVSSGSSWVRAAHSEMRSTAGANRGVWKPTSTWMPWNSGAKTAPPRILFLRSASSRSVILLQ